jgi:phage recombination protein Bet
MQSIITTTQDQNSVWTDESKLVEIKSLLAPKLTTNEFALLVNMGKATGLNPFLREIWAVKYDDKSPAQVFIGRDGYRKVAQANPEYDYHVVESVYENDQFSRENDEVRHSYSLTNRGALVGAYCSVKRKNSSKACFVFVKLAEYIQKSPIWSLKPETMIKKVAEAQGLRMAFQSLFAGTYDESENWKEKSITVEPSTGEIIEAAPISQKELMSAWDKFAKNRYGATLNDTDSLNFLRIALNTHFGKEKLSDLTQDEAATFIKKCNPNQ